MNFSLESNVTYFGETDFRGQRTSFGIKTEDRSRHVYVIGKTGMGKSTLLENMAAQDILRGHGMAFIDPHGSAIETLIDYIPEHRINDVVYFAPFDGDFPIAFNVMESIGHDQRHLVVSGLMSTFKKIWVDAWSARMEYILTNTLLALLEYPDSTLLGVNRMLSDKGFRQAVIEKVTDPTVRAFWVDEYGKWDERYARESGAAIQNKIGQFTANPVIRNIVGQPRSSFDIRELMDSGKILLINLSKGRIGEQNAALLGGMLITKIYLGAMSRADVSKDTLSKLPPFYLFVDEFQNFANESFADILSEARKYKLNLTIAHQYIAQMEEPVADAVFGNVGTTIAFRVGPMDAEVLEKIFAPTFTKEDVVNLGKFQIYLTLMIDGVGSKPFSATTLLPVPRVNKSFRDMVIESSRRQFANPRNVIEENIDSWMAKEFSYANPKARSKDGSSFEDRKPTGNGIPPRVTQNNQNRSFVARDQVTNELRKMPERSEKPTATTLLRREVQQPTHPRVRQHVAESLTSDSLSSLLNTLSPDDAQVISQQTSFVTKEPKESTIHKQSPPRAIFGKKDPSPQNKNALKDALAKALQQKQPQEGVKIASKENTRQEEVKRSEDFKSIEGESKKEQDSYQVSHDDESSYQSIPLSKQKTREVPEDVLRRILES